MQRTVISSADLSGQALTDLKDWLGITRPNEDNLLINLLEVSLAMCESFTGQVPIEQVIETIVPTYKAEIEITTKPVRALVSVEGLDSDASRSLIVPEAYDFAINAQGVGCLRLSELPDTQRAVITIRAGVAADWSGLPRPLKQGMIRLAAFNYRDRESGRSAAPPASVAVLWRPWRVMRIA